MAKQSHEKLNEDEDIIAEIYADPCLLCCATLHLCHCAYVECGQIFEIHLNARERLTSPSDTKAGSKSTPKYLELVILPQIFETSSKIRGRSFKLDCFSTSN
jgi:hypothetical protein